MASYNYYMLRRLNGATKWHVTAPKNARALCGGADFEDKRHFKFEVRGSEINEQVVKDNVCNNCQAVVQRGQ